ncbi:carboxypeptidase S [Sistotremastrum suecicum HHB10207 ss-3]|uniref:Carboxypeptidase S n=1 Tax=Sistotremastrum suecicum HHB10207 ss-3 TaxID=1314776 RepID=A0A166HVQ1_9AGAM|nr:carboxypeptidase S [Sistotremastrum suecicum HHB10207 ss-3]
MAGSGEKSERDALLLEPVVEVSTSTRAPRRTRSRKLLYSCGAIYLLFHIFWAESFLHFLHGRWLDHTTESLEALCPQPEGIVPVKHKDIAEDLSGLYSTQEFKQDAIKLLSGAVQIPTEVYDHMSPVGQDPRWLAFGPFHDYLAEKFPLIYSTLKVTKVNTYALLYEWIGSDASLKPILLAAHQDVVPVDPLTVDKWVQPPYSGFFDGEYIWGRGASDDKGSLISIMIAIESLIAKGFKPSRTVVLSFGCDEEADGSNGAAKLAPEILKIYGEDAFAMLVDEGNGYSEKYGAIFAVPAIAEKGYLNAKIEVRSPGGHSSTPPEHTSIGVLASMLVQYESHPFKTTLERSAATYHTIQCFGAHGDLPRDVKKSIRRSLKSDRALREVQDYFFKVKEFKAQVGTTQAIDVITGGVKANALPESASAIINHRIALDSSLAAVEERDTALVKSLAIHYNFSLNAFEEDIIGPEGPFDGSITLTDAFKMAFDPAPITPTDPEAQAYRILSGTIIATHEASDAYKTSGKPIYVAPGVSTGNTDTRFYWKLTKNIFRYNHKSYTSKWPDIHTINEAIRAGSYFELIKFWSNLIMNVDESDEI